MHSRIFQIGASPIPRKEFIDESFFYENSFIGSVADNVSGDNNRAEDIEDLRIRLERKKSARFDFDESGAVVSFTLLPGFKDRYFAEAYDVFVAAQSKMSLLHLQEFSSGGVFEEVIQEMSDAYCDTFGFYVAMSEDVMPLDNFIRRANVGTPYYIGGVLDYHW